MATRRYALYIAAYFLMAIAASSAGVAMSFGVLAATGSTSLLSVNLALYFLPALLSPLSGGTVDRYGTRPVLGISILSRVILLAIFAVVVSCWKSTASVIALMAITLLVGILKLPTSPAMRKIFSEILPSELYVKGNAHLSIAGQTGAAISFLVVGVVIDHLNVTMVLATASALFMVVGILTWPLPNVLNKTKTIRPRSYITFDIAGYSAIKRSAVLTSSTGFVIVTMMSFTPAEAVLPEQMEKLGYGASGFTHFLLAYSLGVLCGGFFIGRYDAEDHIRKILPAAGAVLVLSLTALAIDAGLWVLLFTGALVGSSCAVFDSVSMARVHLHASKEVQGRVFAALQGIESFSRACLLGVIAVVTALGVGSLLWLAIAVGVSVLAILATKATKRQPRVGEALEAA
ncbi:MFS transporter [Streptomyces sp. NPDC020794]|uniref:MFS transporter n=1 Tax=unclassified Streptomyces TaxID=2593676 RepID=UPI0036ECA303